MSQGLTTMTNEFLFILIVTPSIAFTQQIVFETHPKSFNEADIRKELGIYPASILKQCVELITIKKFDDKALGMSHYLFKTVELNKAITRQQFPEVLHHELSSMFLLNIDSGYRHMAFKYYQRKFDALNPIGFEYNLNIDVRKLSGDEKNYFASNTYSMTGFENDWNQICEALFTNPSFLREANTNFPVYKKALLAIEFYHNRIDPKFTLEYFKSTIK